MLIPPAAAGRRTAESLCARLRHRTTTFARSRPSSEPAAPPRPRPTATWWTAVWDSAANEQYFAIDAARRAHVDAVVRRLVTDRPSVPASYDEAGRRWSVEEAGDGVTVRLEFQLVDPTRQLVVTRVSAD